jgi:hypothetical protein
MDSFDPDTPRHSADWLRTDEGQRIELVSSCHRRNKVHLPTAQLHVVINVVVENQLALGVEVVVEALARLQGEGLSRHDALHAIGSVLAADLYELMQDRSEATGDVYVNILTGFKSLRRHTGAG